MLFHFHTPGYPSLGHSSHIILSVEESGVEMQSQSYYIFLSTWGLMDKLYSKKKKKKTLQGDRELQQLKTLETASEAVSHLLCLEIGLIPGIDVLYINRAMKRSKGC